MRVYIIQHNHYPTPIAIMSNKKEAQRVLNIINRNRVPGNVVAYIASYILNYIYQPDIDLRYKKSLAARRVIDNAEVASSYSITSESGVTCEAITAKDNQCSRSAKYKRDDGLLTCKIHRYHRGNWRFDLQI